MPTWNDVGIEIPASLTGAGGDLNLPCPQCQHTRQAAHRHARPLSVNLVKKVWNCHHCGWRGKLNEPASQQTTPRPQTRQKQMAQIHYQKGEMADFAREWLYQRGITDHVIHRRQIGWTMARFGGEEKPAFQFPFFHGHECVNIKYRTIDKRFTQTAGGMQCLYGLEYLDDTNDCLTIVEGELDVLACDVAQIDNVVSLPSGGQISDALFQSMEPLLHNMQRIVLAGDSDEKGQKCMAEIARRLGPERCWKVSWPDGCKDANDTLVQHGPDRIWDCLANARAWPVAGIIEPQEIFEAFDTLYNHGVPRGVAPPWTSLRHHYRVRPGEVTVITGIPGSGKSVWISALLVHLAQEENWRISVFTPEMLPLERYMVMLAEQYIGKPFDDGWHGQRMSPQEKNTARHWIQQYFTFLLPEDDAPTVPFLLGLAKVEVLRHGITALVIDPWNEIEHTRPPNITETEYISQSLTSIRRFARTHSIHIFIIAHPTKLQKEKNGEYPVPTAYDIAGSASWRNKADNIIAVARPFTEDSPKTMIVIQKVRFREIGKLGKIELSFDKSTGRYMDLSTYGAIT